MINPYYFCKVCEGEENKKLWDEVYEYMEHTYDLNQVKKIYLNADGGSWITFGMRRMAGITYVLDEFHLNKVFKKDNLLFRRRCETKKKRTPKNHSKQE